jgi:predicted GH43/DUF377 family glycosyl hydrolase
MRGDPRGETVARGEPAVVAVERSDISIAPDSRRVVARPFIPGFVGTFNALGGARVDQIAERVMKLSPGEVARLLDETRRLFHHRHRDLEQRWEEHFITALPHSERMQSASRDMRKLLGAVFTHEYSFEGAALCNPSLVEHPEGSRPGELAFIMSARAIGEGHISSIEFRTGHIDKKGAVIIDPVFPVVEVGRRTSVIYGKRGFMAKMAELGGDPGITSQVCDPLPARFSLEDLEQSMPHLEMQMEYAADAFETVRLIHWLASSNYRLEFGESEISERLIFPAGPADSNGMEDARFVKFVDDDEQSTYYATYTAYDGFQILPQLIQTSDFRTFEIMTMDGAGAKNKGMALFPSKIEGRYAALSRHDRESLYLMYSDDIRSWGESELIYPPTEGWEAIQIGNCGSPLPTPDGWLVLTHGVGPMRRYAIGAVLLDSKDPSRVIGRLARPFLVPGEVERDGYVPNVVYSCGGLINGENLVLPFGVADHHIGVATVALSELIDSMISTE